MSGYTHTYICIYIHAHSCMSAYILMSPEKTMSIICILCVGVCIQSLICLHDRMKLSSLNGIFLCPCPVSVSYAYKVCSYIKLGDEYTDSKWYSLVWLYSHTSVTLEPDLSTVLCLWFSLLCAVYIREVNALAGQIYRATEKTPGRFMHICS